MAVQGQWTDATRVRAYVKSGSALTDAQMEDIIANAESFISAFVKFKDYSAFALSESKRLHLALREAATLRAAMLVIASTPMSFRTLDEASMAANIISDMYLQSLKLLEDSGVIEDIERS